MPLILQAREELERTASFSAPPRLHSLDAIRGGFALGVMVYHIALWSGLGSAMALGTYGVYSVRSWHWKRNGGSHRYTARQG
jgi:hypothetical protein